ncbi:hypothetical protein [Streptosporangium pseudovulgare]|uniref:Cupin n=1 Tax=Streptosporangium pseudovulgare TaxID=35765 RepID=A0ABQ2QFL2_9ACTN|nr:hypothetical protein [Streptosporangium pseudovulgare]GGP76380.1 hypothetical protein GCM10010140_00210 [Streptosporangium pseudovulgare]
MRYQELYEEMTGGRGGEALRGWAGRVLRDIASGASPVAGVRHPLGFLCLPLERTGEYGVCLHIWSGALPRAASTTSQIHCHSWDLVSHVLYGRVENVRADVGDAGGGAGDDAGDGAAGATGGIPGHAGEATGGNGGTPGHAGEATGGGGGTTVPPGATHRVFEVVSDAGGDRVLPTPRTVRCAPGVSEVYGPGETYTLPAGVFHSSVVPGGETATIALGHGRPGRSDLSLGPLGLGAHLVPRHRCDARETARAALHAAGRLS